MIKEAFMQLQISGNKIVRDLQKDFNSFFPFLKIEFFRNLEGRKLNYPATMMLPNTLTIQDATSQKITASTFSFNENTTVAELEIQFMELFGLSIQVFRRSGNIWLETTMTDNWTLQRQNSHGKEISGSQI